MTHDYKRHGTTTLFAALNILDGTVIGHNMKRYRHQEFIRFLNTIEAQVPVAVGTRIAPRPPHRSRRALLTHRAPPSGFGVEAVTWQRVQHLDLWEEAVGEAGELGPGQEHLLALPLGRLQPAAAQPR